LVHRVARSALGGIKPFKGTDAEALDGLDGVVMFAASSVAVDVGTDAIHVFDQASAELDGQLERFSAMRATRKTASEGPGRPEPHPAPSSASGGQRFARHQGAGTILRPRAGTVG
jgi:hypothetical protein